jgi:hypothetical protein
MSVNPSVLPTIDYTKTFKADYFSILSKYAGSGSGQYKLMSIAHRAIKVFMIVAESSNSFFKALANDLKIATSVSTFTKIIGTFDGVRKIETCKDESKKISKVADLFNDAAKCALAVGSMGLALPFIVPITSIMFAADMGSNLIGFVDQIDTCVASEDQIIDSQYKQYSEAPQDAESKVAWEGVKSKIVWEKKCFAMLKIAKHITNIAATTLGILSFALQITLVSQPVIVGILLACNIFSMTSHFYKESMWATMMDKQVDQIKPSQGIEEASESAPAVA